MTDQQPEADARNGRLGWRVLDLSYLRNPHDLFAAIVYAALIIGGIAVFAAGLWMLGRTIAAIFDSARSPDDINKLLLSLAGLIGAPFVIWRVTIAARANRIAAETAKETSRIAQENLYTTLLTKAVEQLGATREEKVSAKGGDGKMETEIKTVPNTEVRLGAIYALEKLARDYEPLHWPIMEILCAYVRKNCGPPPPEMSEEVRAAYGALPVSDGQRRQIAERETALRAPYVDVQAALTVIGRRGADRRALEAELRATSANPDAYRLDFTGAALMKARLEGLHFESTLFTGACLEGARVKRAHLEGASLNSAHLEGAHLDEAHLERAWLHGAHLERAWLHRAHLEGALLNSAHLEGAWLSSAHLEGAWLEATRLEGAWLYGARLKGARLNGARLTEADFDDASLDDALLDGADLTAAKNLSIVSLAAAWGDDRTVLPSGVDRPINKRWVADGTDESLSLQRLFNARSYEWSARRDFWLGEARKRREAEAAARGNPLPG